MNIRRVIAAAALGSGVYLMTGWTAEAGVLATDPAALSAFRGTVAFSATVGPLAFNANVDYAVYQPGAFGSSTALGSPSDPSAGSQYVYAYELINTGDSTERSVGVLSIGFTGDTQPANIGVYSGTGLGTNPSLDSFIPSGGPVYTFGKLDILSELTSGQASNILIFTSPYAPHFDNASVQGGGMTDPRTLPTPTPEPSSILVIAGVSLSLLTGRRRNG